MSKRPKKLKTKLVSIIREGCNPYRLEAIVEDSAGQLYYIRRGETIDRSLAGLGPYWRIRRGTSVEAVIEASKNGVVALEQVIVDPPYTWGVRSYYDCIEGL